MSKTGEENEFRARAQELKKKKNDTQKNSAKVVQDNKERKNSEILDVNVYKEEELMKL